MRGLIERFRRWQDRQRMADLLKAREELIASRDAIDRALIEIDAELEELQWT